MTGPAEPDRLALRDPIRLLLSPAPWLATAYLASYAPVGAICFGISVAVVASAVVNITWLALPWLVVMAAILRGAATVERWRAQLVGPPIPSPYQPVPGPGLFASIRVRWRDRATYRDCAYLIGMFVPLLVLDVVGLAVWLAGLAGITLPVWYWSISPRHSGLSWLDNMWAASVAAFVCLVLLPLLAYVVVGAAATHRAVVRTLLGPYVDPLAEAKQILAGPGPLRALDRSG